MSNLCNILHLSNIKESEMQMRPHMRPGDMASYDRTPLGQSGRSRTVSNPYGGYSDTEVMGPAAENRLYGRDPYLDHPRDDRYAGPRGGGSYYDDHRSGPPPLRPSGSNYGDSLADERVQGPPPPPRPGVSGYERSEGIRRPIIAEHAHGEMRYDSDMESVASAFSSHSAPHQRRRRPG